MTDLVKGSACREYGKVNVIINSVSCSPTAPASRALVGKEERLSSNLGPQDSGMDLTKYTTETHYACLQNRVFRTFG